MRNSGQITTNRDIWCTESSGGIHNALKHNKNYIASEYFGDSHKSGEKVGGTLHVNLLETGFSNNTFDVILTCDVLEHIPDPYRAFREIHRILKTGGTHIFTVPFYQTMHLDEKRAEIIGKDMIHHMDPLYHLDPHNPGGILVYNIFSMEMLISLAKIGFYTTMHKLYDWKYGIFGNNGLVFESRKI